MGWSNITLHDGHDYYVPSLNLKRFLYAGRSRRHIQQSVLGKLFFLSACHLPNFFLSACHFPNLFLSACHFPIIISLIGFLRIHFNSLGFLRAPQIPFKFLRVPQGSLEFLRVPQGFLGFRRISQGFLKSLRIHSNSLGILRVPSDLSKVLVKTSPKDLFICRAKPTAYLVVGFGENFSFLSVIWGKFFFVCHFVLLPNFEYSNYSLRFLRVPQGSLVFLRVP